jgi:Toprim-like
MRAVGDVLERLGISAERRGRRWWAEQCPLPSHGAPNPAHRYQNWFIRDDESEERPGQHWCFSCKNGGTLVQLVEEVRNVTREEARAWLETIGDRPPPPVLRVRFDPVGPRRFALPAGVEFMPMRDWNSVARDYAERRGITDEQVERWGIGVAHEGRLANRIVVPIRDLRGRVTNYSARTFVNDPVRYLAASERERPDLSVMWGEEQWSSDLIGRAIVVVVEGVLNGLAFERALAPSSLLSFAALQGSDVDDRKMAKLASFRTVVVATDNDRAGEKARREIYAALARAPGTADRARRDVGHVEFPAGSDACDLTPEFLRSEVLRCVGTIDRPTAGR